MKRINLYESLVIQILLLSPKIGCIDIEFFKNKKLFAKQHGFIFRNEFIGSYTKWNSLLKDLNRDFKKTNLDKFLKSLGYYPKQGKKYLLAIKENTLDLY